MSGPVDQVAAWTDGEAAYLAEHYAKDGPEACARHLGRSVKSVYNRAYASGLTSAHSQWTTGEDEELARLMAAGAGHMLISRLLGRTCDAVRTRAKNRGLRMAPRPAPWTAQLDRALVECAESGWTLADAAEELGVTMPEALARATELGLSFGGVPRRPARRRPRPVGWTADAYQEEALRTARGMMGGDKAGLRLLNGAMGLGGECGECIDIVKKHVFHGHRLDRAHLAEELGDVLWYVAVAADAIGYPLGEVAEINVKKLRRRYPDGFDPERSKNREE